MHESSYSTLIAGLKILLPLTALGLLSTMFLLSRTIESENAVPFLEDASQIPKGDSVSAPYYTGSTPEGHAVAITADSARPMPEDPGGMIATRLDAVFDLVDGSRIHIVADTAEVNEPEDHLDLAGEVVIDSSQGYEVHTQRLVAALRSITAESPGTVSAIGPIGTLDAGRFRIRENDETGNVQLFFTNGVKLIYEPAKQESIKP